MKKKRWRLLAAVLALAMVMGMAAGCSGKGESEKKTADSGKREMTQKHLRSGSHGRLPLRIRHSYPLRTM